MKIPGEKVKVVVRTGYKVAGIKCDVCGHIIEVSSMNDNYKYYAVTTGHHDWGNDSCESIRHYDICPNCINNFVTEYLGSKDAYQTAYIDIETIMLSMATKWLIEEDE